MTDFFRFLAKEVFYIMTGEATKRLKLLKMQTELYPEDVDGRNRLAQVYITSNLLQEAIAEYLIIQQLVNQPEVYADDIGYIYVRMNDLPSALKYMKKYAASFPKETTSFNNLAYVYQLMGNDELVKENYEKTLFLEPDNLSATLNLAKLDIKHGRFDRAIEVFQTALKQFEGSREKIQILNQLTSVSTIKGQPKNALKFKKSALKELEKISPPLNIIIQKLADIIYFVRAGKNDEALTILKHAKNTLKPPFQDVPSLGYALYYLELEQPNKAAEQILILEKTLKNLGSTLNGLSSLHIRMKAKTSKLQKDYAKAIEGYKAYSQLIPTDISISYQLGRVYNLSGDFDTAESYLLKHLENSPFEPLTHLELGKLYLKQNKMGTARQHLQKARDVWIDAEKGYQYADENKLLLLSIK